MKAVVIYESEFGATRRIAEAIASGLASHVLTDLHNVRDLILDDPQWRPRAADLLVLGCPTHARTMPSPASRAEAQTWPHRPGSTLTLEPRALLNGIREWLRDANLPRQRVVTFATRAGIPRLLSGSAAAALARAAHGQGAQIIAKPMSFTVTKEGGVEREELARARDWGRALAVELTTDRDLV